MQNVTTSPGWFLTAFQKWRLDISCFGSVSQPHTAVLRSCLSVQWWDVMRVGSEGRND